jgi:hypothetical protein
MVDRTSLLAKFRNKWLFLFQSCKIFSRFCWHSFAYTKFYTPGPEACSFLFDPGN